MKQQNDSKKWNDRKMVASSYFIFALSLLVCTLSLPFTENFSELEFFISGFGIIVIDYGLLLLINPYRRLTLFNWKSIGAPKISMYNIGGIKKMVSDEKFFDHDVLKSSPKINITFGIIATLFGITFVVIAFVLHY